MNGYRVGLAVAFVVVALALTSVGVVAMGDAPRTASTADNESAMGERIGAFMHSTTATADGSIERGLFEESLNESTDGEAAVRDRIAQLEAEYDAAKNRSASLESDSSLSDPARRATLVRLTIQLDSLNASIAETERHATTAGVDTERLERLKANASELSGPEVAEVARGMAGVDPPGLSDDHPGNGGQGADNPGTDDPGNGTPGTDNPGNGTPGTDNPGNGTQGPDNPGNGDPGTENPGNGAQGADNPGTGDAGNSPPEDGTPGAGSETDSPGNGNHGGSGASDETEGGPPVDIGFVLRVFD